MRTIGSSISRVLLPILLLVVAVATGVPPAAGTADEERLSTERFFANAIAPASFGVGRVQVEIRILRWSTDEEHQEVVDLLNAEGARRMPRTLRRHDVTGTLRQTGRSPWNLRYAREVLEGDRRQIVAIADRPIVLGQNYRNQRRTGDHQTTLVTLDVDEAGVGRGELIPGIEIAVDAESGSLVAANRLVEPIELANVRKR